MRRQITFISIDIFLVVAATSFAGAIRDNFDLSLDRIAQLLPYVGWTALSAGVVLPLSGVSRSIWRFSSLIDYARAVPAAIAIVLGAVAIGFVFNRLENVARSLPLLQGILIIFLLVGVRVAFRLYHARRRQKPKLLTPAKVSTDEVVLVMGLNRVAELYLHSIREFAADRATVVGLLGRSDRQTGRLLQGVPVLGMPEDASAVVNELGVRGIFVTRIIVTMPFEKLSSKAQSVLLHLERDAGLKLDLFAERLILDPMRGSAEAATSRASDRVAPTMAPPSAEKTADRAAFVIDLEALHALSRQPFWAAKRMFDIAGALLFLLILSPLFIVVGALVAFDIGWPMTFWQQRPGLAGYGFRLYKFRSMAAAYDSHGKRIPDEQRQTVTGTFLRKSRLDELPQLIHILMGEMSFVGPRPLLPIDQAPEFSARLLVRPGMTGWAQVKGGRRISAVDKAALDVWYVNNASLWLDAKILLLTIPIILFGERVDVAAIARAWRDLVAEGICAPSSLPIEYRANVLAA